MIKRTLFKEIKDHLNKKEVTFIVGPRQAGKTTLMLLLKKHLDSREEKTLFLSLDKEADNRHFVSQNTLLKKIQLETGDKRAFIFIDEIQRKADAGIFLKGIFDMNLPYKLIISGSGSVELKEKLHESLVGRKRLFELSVISFQEFVNHRTSYRYEENLKEFFSIEREKGKSLLEEYLDLGGYPRLVVEEELVEKRKIIDEIYRSYLERDVSYLLGVSKQEAFSSLFRLLSSQEGRLVNYSELSSTLGIAVSTVKKYLWYMEKTYILRRVIPYFRNMRKEITKSPVFYFYDLGLKNYAAGVFGSLEYPLEQGFLFQNFVLNILKERTRFSNANIHFWRTKWGAEVDFVIDLGRTRIPIEVKSKVLKKPLISRAFHSFLRKYKPRRAYIINLELEREVKVGSTTVKFLPFYQVMFENFT